MEGGGDLYQIEEESDAMAAGSMEEESEKGRLHPCLGGVRKRGEKGPSLWREKGVKKKPCSAPKKKTPEREGKNNFVLTS